MTLHILLVDDNHTFIAAVRQFLDRLPGVQIVGHADDGKSLALARAIRQEPLLATSIFLSMHDNQECRAAAHELDVGFVSKSDFVTELMSLPKDLAQRHADPLPG